MGVRASKSGEICLLSLKTEMGRYRLIVPKSTPNDAGLGTRSIDHRLVVHDLGFLCVRLGRRAKRVAFGGESDYKSLRAMCPFDKEKGQTRNEAKS